MNPKAILPLWRGVVLVGCICWTALVQGQGLLVVEATGERVRLPRPAPTPGPRSYQIKELAVEVRLNGQVAQVQVGQTFRNTGSENLEVAFTFPLPYDGAVDQLTLMVDGREVPGKVLSAEEARAHYEQIVLKNRDPALLEWLGTGLFRTSVFPVPAGAERKVSLRYTQLCRQQGGLTDFLFPLSTAKYTSQPPERVAIDVVIASGVPIKNVYSPTHSVQVDRTDERQARVRFSSENQVPQDDFRLLYDVGPGQLATSLLSYRSSDTDDGYFLLLGSPQLPAADAQPTAKTVLMVVDRSGSMSGEKFTQAQAAVRFVLDNLREGDLFNIVAYDSQPESFRSELERVTDETRKQARNWVERLFAGGGTNIDAALGLALKQLRDTARPTYVFFLTDGLPTEGETSEAQIVERSKALNQVHARVMAFGVGYDVNSRLLDKLAREHFGQSEYVRPSENIEAHVSRLYQRVESPILTEVKLAWQIAGSGELSPVNRTYPPHLGDLFAGEQVVVVGRYHVGGQGQVTISGQLAGEAKSFEFPVELAAAGSDPSNAFIEKLWATRRVGEILDQLDLKGQNSELVKELVELATRHGILTPYTSFLADEETDLNEVAANTATAERHLGRFSATEGADAFLARRQKQFYQQAGGGRYAGTPAPGAAATPPPTSLGVALARDESDNLVPVDTVQNMGSKTFYKRHGQWLDSTLTEAQQNRAIRIVQFSGAYFDLAARHGRELAPYLVFDEPVLLNLAGQGYLIVPEGS